MKGSIRHNEAEINVARTAGLQNQSLASQRWGALDFWMLRGSWLDDKLELFSFFSHNQFMSRKPNTQTRVPMAHLKELSYEFQTRLWVVHEPNYWFAALQAEME